MIFAEMKPKDLKHPFRWEDRRPLIDGRVFYVPDYYQEHHLFTFPLFEESPIFGNARPVHLEYCSGNGTWIVEKALADPDTNWVAVERDFERVRKIVSKGCNLKLSNLFVICGEAFTFTKHYVRDHSIEQIYVNFPDPWPKDKHAKHRLFQPLFADETARVIKPGKRGIFVTDDPPYSEQICSVMRASNKWEPSYPDPYYLTEREGYGTSFFEELWREKGKTIRYIEMKSKKPE